jgi:hypothetical protein
MADKKFNPIAQLPTLPGSEVASDELQSKIIKSSQTHTEKVSEKKVEKDNENEKNIRASIIKGLLLAGIIGIIILGIFLTLNFIPKIASNASNLSKSFSSIFTPKETPAPVVTTSTSTPSRAVSTSTRVTSGVIAKGPAKLSVNLMTRQVINGQTILKFYIQNDGGMESGPWSFSATLVSNVTPMYHSPMQTSLAPGSGMIYTLQLFDNLYTPIQIVTYSQNGKTANY